MTEKASAIKGPPPPRLFIAQPASFDITAVGKDSTQLNLQDYRGRIIILNIWATWCGPCIRELPSLGTLSARYADDKDVAVICLSEEEATIVFGSKVAQESKAPIYSTNDTSIPKIYKTGSIPATFIIDKQGTIVARHIGGADWAAPAVISLIESLKKQPAPEPATLTP